jgi:hypothetical protein
MENNTPAADNTSEREIRQHLAMIEQNTRQTRNAMFLVAWIAVLVLAVSVIAGVAAGIELGHHNNTVVSPYCQSQGGDVAGC